MPIVSRRSYTETVEGRRHLLSRLKLLLFLFLAFELVSGLFIAAYSVSTASMMPGIAPGDRLLVSPLPFGPSTALGKLPPIGRPGRGDIVLVDPPYAREEGFWITVLDSGLRFLSAQRYSPLRRGNDALLRGPLLERVIALPGDEVLMEDFIFKVRPVGQEHFLTEFELSSEKYDVAIPALPEGWKSSYPLSGSMPKKVLGKDEYFVAGDDRGTSGDSRHWGPIGHRSLKAAVFFRYWPLSRIGVP